MRPWCLNHADASYDVPLLNAIKEAQGSFSHTTEAIYSRNEATASACTRSIHTERSKNSRSRRATEAKAPLENDKKSYAVAWKRYIDRGVASETNKRYITNLLMATAAKTVEGGNDESDDPDMFESPFLSRHAGNMEVVHMTLQGISKKSKEDGQE